MKKYRIPSFTVIAEGISKTHSHTKGGHSEVSYLLRFHCWTSFLIVIRNRKRTKINRNRKQELLVVEAESMYFKNWTLCKFRQTNNTQSICWLSTWKQLVWCEGVKDVDTGSEGQRAGRPTCGEGRIPRRWYTLIPGEDLTFDFGQEFIDTRITL